MKVGPATDAADGERARAEAILQQHHTMLHGYLRHLLSSPADAADVAQELCVMVLAQPAILLRGSDPAAYLRGIARHPASRHRQVATRSPVLEELIETAWLEGRPAQETERELEALADCLQKVPERMRRVLDWRYRDGLSSEEIARRVSMSREAVRMAMMRTRQALARCLAQRLAGGAGG